MHMSTRRSGISCSSCGKDISRTIVPVIDAQSPVAGGSNTSGLGDVLQSFFFSPKAPTAGRWIWGAGVSSTFIQPFVSFTTKTFTTFALNTESKARQFACRTGGEP